MSLGGTMIAMPRFATLAVLFCALATLGWSQNSTALFRQAPPEVEESLRKTVQEFSDLQLQKKWGAAMKFVHEDSLDAFIGAEKDACRAYEIFNITYNESFDEAKVGILCERVMATPVGGGRVPMPFTTDWKRVDGEWKWYVIKHERPEGADEMIMTPFGPIPRSQPTVRLSDEERKTEEARMARNLVPGASLKEIQTPIQVSPNSITLSADKPSSAVATIRNRFPGVMRLQLHWVRLDGLTATVDKDELHQGESAEITIRYEPVGLASPPRNHAVWVETNPMRSANYIKIEFTHEERSSEQE